MSYGKAGGSSPEQTDISPTAVMVKVIDGLDKYSQYQFRVRGYTVRDGPWSKPVVERTKPDYSEGIPTMSSVKAISSTAITLTWTFTDTNKVYGEFEGFQITYTSAGGTARQINISVTYSYTINGLGKFTNYSVAIAVQNHVYTGPPCTSRKVQTMEDVPSVAPTSLRYKELNATTFAITWDPIPESKRNGILTKYELAVNITGDGAANRRRKRSIETQSTRYILYNLERCAIYFIRVRAYTKAGPGNYSQPLALQTSPPGAPAELNAVPLSPTSIRLRWKPPSGFTGTSGTYTITSRGSKSYWPSFTVTIPRCDKNWDINTLTLTSLVPGTRYEFKITFTTKCGKSQNSTSKTTETEIIAPLPPSVGGVSKTTNITLWTAVQTNGPINWYQIIVFIEKPDQKNLTEQQAANMHDYKSAMKDELNYYITAEIKSSTMDVNQWFIVGDSTTHQGKSTAYKNAPLNERKRHRIYIRAMTYLDTKLQALHSKVALAAVIPATTPVAKETPAGQPVGAIAGAVVAVLVLAAIVVVLVLFKRHRDEERGPDRRDIHLDAIDRAPEQGSSLNLVDKAGPSKEQGLQGAEGGEAIYDEILDSPSKPIPITQFSEYVSDMRESNFIRLHDEYKKFPNGQQFPWTVARKPVNKKKNRYGNIVTYDHSRVVLERIDGDEDSDYVNASFLHGYDGTPKVYIASQGPVPPAFEGFWRMVWEQNTASIVMLTNLVELGKNKCHKYWPDESETYGDINVNNHQTEVFADYVIRTFIVSRGDSKRRYVRQCNFSVWPDRGVSQYVTAVLAFRRKVHALNPSNAGPIIIHCSDGVGRTGAYIVIDAMLERAKKLRNVDIRNYVIAIGKDRPHMVQTAEQYVFIHVAVLEALSCGNTEISSQNLNVAMHKLATVDRHMQLTGYAMEFQRLNHVAYGENSAEDLRIGKSTENAGKNRDPETVALNRCRVVLHKERASDADYINATFIDAYRDRNAFIMTQAPMQHTIVDFWRMIMDYKIGTIVMLNSLTEDEQRYPRYWPQKSSSTYGNIKVEVITKQDIGDIVSTKLKVSRDKKTAEVRHLHHTAWADKCIPERAQSVLDLLDEVQRSQQQCGNAPVVVQCSNGVGRSSTFCAISSVLDHLKTEQVVDVFQVIKRIRVNRPGAVEDLTQYVFCYQIIQKFVESFSEYANFAE